MSQGRQNSIFLYNWTATVTLAYDRGQVWRLQHSFIQDQAESAKSINDWTYVLCHYGILHRRKHDREGTKRYDWDKINDNGIPLPFVISAITVNYNCMKVTTAKFHHFPSQRVCNDDKLLHWNVTNDDDILLGNGTYEMALIYNAEQHDDFEMQSLCETSSRRLRTRWRRRNRRWWHFVCAWHVQNRQ